MRQRWHWHNAHSPQLRINLWALRMQILREAFAAAQVADPLETKAQAAMQVFVAARHQVQLYDDVLPMLQQMRQQWRLGVISNGIADIKLVGLEQHFEVALSAHLFGNAKPHASIFHAACAELAVAPEQTLYVGDDLYFDIEGAQQAGLRAAWMRRDAQKSIQAAHAHIAYEVVCSDMQQLWQWLQQQGGDHANASER